MKKVTENNIFKIAHIVSHDVLWLLSTYKPNKMGKISMKIEYTKKDGWTIQLEK